MATIKKKINKKGVAWRLDYYDPGGRRIRKDFDLKKDAEAYLGKILAAKKEGRYYDVFDVKKESQVTFDELADRYVENFQGQKCFSRLKYYLVDEYRGTFGGRFLSQITFLDLETYCNRRRATPTRTGTPRADSTVNRELSTLRHMLNKAVEWGMLKNNPFNKGSRLMLKEDNQRLRFLTEAEIGALVKECLPHLRPIVEVALHTGMRRGELLSLKWEQIRNGFIYLEGGMVKSGKGRQIPINDEAARVFREVRRGNHLKSPHVFCDSRGRRFYDVKHSFASACRRAGLEGFRFHDLRHTFASHLVMNGVGLKAVQELLGHASLAMTMRYAHLSQGHLQDAVAVLNKLGRSGEGKKNECLKSVHE
ncbi:MAG: tyrosine-type recombinase/integrase [Deltaproteobacteria bacterium]|nr:tyrosine-type recombinase/integrase [Deltaproteobacteria bacterium]